MKIDATKGNSQATCRSGVKRKHVETTSKISRAGGSATSLHFFLLSIIFLSFLKCFKYEFLSYFYHFAVQDICEEQGDCDDDMDEDGEGDKLYTWCLGCSF